MRIFRNCLLIALAATLAAPAAATDLVLEVGSRRGGDVSLEMDAKVRMFAKNVATATTAQRERLQRIGRWDPQVPFTLPTTLYLSDHGRRLGQANFLRGGGGSLTLVFDSSGPRSFPPAYKQLLIDTFAQAESTMNAVFGQPAFNSTIHVRNYDADIGDRDAVAGGYYVPDNGSSEQEIRFPEYVNPEATAVNFVHCLLLAYLGPNGYAFDGFKEGLVRAATMRVCRTAGALPAPLDPGQIESVIESTYDVGTWYDWYNQRGLGGNKFIAPNLRDTFLPPGGSLGGVYLLRYQMGGSAWQKALVQYPGFAAALNQELYDQPSLAGDVPGLVARAQQVINTLGGSGAATLEGRSFAEWFKRQFILETRDTLGLKLICHPIPLPPVGGSNDFGVYDVPVTYFETIAGGNEILLSGTSYPIFWSHIFDRVSPSAQEERMDIAGAYGSVAPNLPNLEGGQPYRTAIDIPVQDRLARVYVPAGGVATGTNPTPNDFYGTVVGASALGTLKVRLTHGVTVVDNIPITNFAFGTRINTSAYLNSNRCRVEVIQTIGATPTTIIDRFVNKGPGPLALDLRVNLGDVVQPFAGGLPKGLSTIGLAQDPHSSTTADILGIPEGELLVARWNGSKNRYDIHPDTGAMYHGAAYFVRAPVAQGSFSIPGKTSPDTAIAVALRPGWNMISNPTPVTIPTSRVSVVHAANVPKPFGDAIGTEVGLTFFEFVPGPNDAATGAPETGTMVAATQFQPNRMYFVRVLVAEGISLLFDPIAPNRPGSGPTGVASPRFVMKLTVDRAGRKAVAYLGQSATATSSFDRKEDSGMSPGSFGLQAVIEENRLYRDMRKSRDESIYTLRVDGLIPNQVYRLTVDFLPGPDVGYRIRRQGIPVWSHHDNRTEFTFRPTASTARYEIKVDRS